MLNFTPMSYESALNELIKNALAEDVGNGDHSTLSTIPNTQEGKAVLKIKQDGVLAGMKVVEAIFRFVQPDVVFKAFKQDGEEMKYGDTAFEVGAKVHTILTCERLVLNCMQRMSGIATLTTKYVHKLEGFKTRLLDTRKTTPNFRLLEKEAVKIGGGVNHRFGLYDMIMLKDNHIDYSGGIEKAIISAYDYVHKNSLNLKIEVETRSLSDVEKVMKTGKIFRIMLDNFSLVDIVAALKIIDGKYETEASGGINLENIESYAATGVNYISSGAVIHQAVSLDLSLKAILV